MLSTQQSLFSRRIILNNMFVDKCLLRCTLNVLSVQNLSVHPFILKYRLLQFKGHWLEVVGADWSWLVLVGGGSVEYIHWNCQHFLKDYIQSSFDRRVESCFLYLKEPIEAHVAIVAGRSPWLCRKIKTAIQQEKTGENDTVRYFSQFIDRDWRILSGKTLSRLEMKN